MPRHIPPLRRHEVTQTRSVLVRFTQLLQDGNLILQALAFSVFTTVGLWGYFLFRVMFVVGPIEAAMNRFVSQT